MAPHLMIEVIHLHKSFQTAGGMLDILTGVNLTIQQGEMMAIVGASGVGKSTFLHILGALDRPSSGKVLFKGADLFQNKKNRCPDFATKMSVLYFNFTIFCRNLPRWKT
jgi:lipoprotein-releasing system ATP-binding protein